MLTYACLVPHSPLLLPNVNSIARSTHTETSKCLAAIATELEALGIKTIVTIAAHARYEREGFSLSIARDLSIDFSPFGDLSSQLEMKPHWPLYHRVREISIAASLPVHPLDDERLDYGHGIPLWLLQQTWMKLNDCRLLAINDHDSLTSRQRLDFGSMLAQAIALTPEPVAVICSGDLHTTRPDALPWDTVKERNTKMREQIHNLFDIDLPPQTEGHEITCINGPAMILRGMRRNKGELLMEERCFEQAEPTSFLCATWSRGA
jgi:aromatic ring-opening dioxygenase catalytic subunit (LigB family)